MASQSARARLVNEEDYSLIFKAVNSATEELVEAGTKPLANTMDPEVAVDFLIYSNTHSYILDETFLVAYTIGEPWFSKDKFLGELMVIRVAGLTGSLKDVKSFLQSEAERHSCKWIAVGTLLSPREEALSALYTRSGYSKSLIQLVKEV